MPASTATRVYCVVDTTEIPLESIDCADTCHHCLDSVRRSKDQRFAILKLACKDLPAFTHGQMVFGESGIREFLAARANEW